MKLYMQSAGTRLAHDRDAPILPHLLYKVEIITTVVHFLVIRVLVQKDNLTGKTV